MIEINPLGEKFDPHRHQAISHGRRRAASRTRVINVLQKGYAARTTACCARPWWWLPRPKPDKHAAKPQLELEARCNTPIFERSQH
ncbi:MAG: nucleotide exchange factor GrpE [Nitrosomonas sp.]